VYAGDAAGFDQRARRVSALHAGDEYTGGAMRELFAQQLFFLARVVVRDADQRLESGLTQRALRGFEQIDEERRLAYVGVTRAGRTLSLSWSEQVGSSTQGSARPRQRSRFVQEIGTGNLRAGGARATRAARPRS